MFLGLALQSPGSTLFEDRDDVAGPLANRRRFRLVCSPGREPLNLSCNSIRLGSGPAATDKVAVEASSNLLVVTKAHQERASVRRWLRAAERWNRRHHTRSTKVAADPFRSEEQTSELQSLMRTSYAVFCLKKKNANTHK